MIANILKKPLSSLKKILSTLKFPTILTLITTFALKIGHVINLTNSILSSSGITDKITDFFTNPKTWLNNSSVSERFINAATIFASWLPENLVGKVAIVWLNTKDYLRTNMSNQTTALVASLVFWSTTLIVAVRENFKTNALRGYYHRLMQEQKEPGTPVLTNEEINVFNVGVNSSNSVLSKLKTCFNKEAILNPTAYYAGLKFASLPQNDKRAKVFINLKNNNAFGNQHSDEKPSQNNFEQNVPSDEPSLEKPVTKIPEPSSVVFDSIDINKDLTSQKPFVFTTITSTKKPLNLKLKPVPVPVRPNLHKDSRELSAQETQDKNLYAFEDRSLWGNATLTHVQLKQVENLLIDGANPNYVPPQNEYRMPSSMPCSLISIAIFSGDLDFFNLLLKYDANIFQESQSNNLVLWDACTRVITPTVLKPEFVTILNTILEKLGTTTEEVRKNLPGTDIGIIPLQQFVEDMKKAKSNVSSLRPK